MADTLHRKNSLQQNQINRQLDIGFFSEKIKFRGYLMEKGFHEEFKMFRQLLKLPNSSKELVSNWINVIFRRIEVWEQTTATIDNNAKGNEKKVNRYTKVRNVGRSYEQFVRRKLVVRKERKFVIHQEHNCVNGCWKRLLMKDWQTFA